MRIRFLVLVLVFLGFGLYGVPAQEKGEPPAETPKTISGGVLNGKATKLVSPAYPAAARSVKASGAVNVQVTIDEQGGVISASAVSGHPLLRAAAVEAARQSKFSPTTLQGKAVKVTGVIVYNFVPPKETTETRESEKLGPIGLVMFLSAMKDLPGDEESDQILRDLGSELPESMKTDKSQLERLARAETSDEKGIIVEEIIVSMRKKSNGSEVWMIDLGKHWGSAIGEAFKITNSNYNRDRQNFIKNLQGMGWLLEAPPKDISPETLKKIRTIASFNSETDTVSPQFIADFFKASLEFIEFMINDGKRGNS
jgi:TonB family protein